VITRKVYGGNALTMEFMVRVQSELKPKGCHPERSRRTSLTWVTSSAFVRSALRPVAIPFARDDIAMLWVLRPVDWCKLPDNHRLLRPVAMAPMVPPCKQSKLLIMSGCATFLSIVPELPIPPDGLAEL